MLRLFLLVLNTLAEGKEAIVSRGELIEIGGEFRIPEIMTRAHPLARSGHEPTATRLADYEKAIQFQYQFNFKKCTPAISALSALLKKRILNPWLLWEKAAAFRSWTIWVAAVLN